MKSNDGRLYFCTNSGRLITCSRLLITETFGEFICGDPVGMTKMIRENHEEVFKKEFWECRESLLIDNHGPVLPHYRILCYLESGKPVRKFDYSVLMPCFYVDKISDPIQKILQYFITDEAWNMFALDCDWANL